MARARSNFRASIAALASFIAVESDAERAELVMPIWFAVAVPLLAFGLGFWAGRSLKLQRLRAPGAPDDELPDEVDVQRLIHKGIRKLERAVDGVVEDSYRDRFGPIWWLYYKRLDSWVVLGLLVVAVGFVTHFLFGLAQGAAATAMIWEPVVAVLACAGAFGLDRLRRSGGLPPRREGRV